jgi:F0F1-type ATP synthase assembly protein I
MNEQNGQKYDKQATTNLTMAAIASQVGVVTIVIIFGALILGLVLDRYFDTKPLFTLLLLVFSMPVTVYLMIKIVKGATDRIKPIIKQKESKDNLEGGNSL